MMAAREWIWKTENPGKTENRRNLTMIRLHFCQRTAPAQRNLEAKALVVLRAFLVRLENPANLEWTENWVTMVLEVNPVSQVMPANRDPRDQPVTKGRLYRRVLYHRDLLENQELTDQSALSVRLVWLAKMASMVLLVLKAIWELREKTDKRDPRANQVLKDHQGPKALALIVLHQEPLQDTEELNFPYPDHRSPNQLLLLVKVHFD